MSGLTPEETRWLKRVNRALKECPSDRLGFYTIGDREVFVYDFTQEAEIERLMNTVHNTDFCQAVDRLDAGLGLLHFPKSVLSTAG